MPVISACYCNEKTHHCVCAQENLLRTAKVNWKRQRGTEF